ncbi:MAG: ABC transporter ATP-binding protein [Oscillospiraceae bacterium]|nr:ABC transporter ATP-binding protein [Oscillospiraceae bacterium]
MVVKTLLKSVREYKKDSFLAPLFISLEVVLECFIPFVMASLIDNMTGESLSPVLKYGSILIVLAFCSLFCGFMSGKHAATASCGFAKNLRQDLYFRIQEFSFADVDKFSSSSLVTRLTTDVFNVQNAYQMLLRIAVRTPLMVIFSFIMSYSLSPRLSIIFICILPILAIALSIIISVCMKTFRIIFRKYDRLNNSVQENVAGIRVVKSFVREDYEQEKFSRASSSVKRDFTHVEKILALNNPIMSFCVFSSILLISYLGSQLIITTGATEFTTGELSSLINYGVQILVSMMMLSMVFVMTSMAAESARRISEVLNWEPTLVSGDDGASKVEDGSVSFKNVSFRYSEKAERNSLENINLDIRSGETIGILGGTGSSKTTLIQLIPRLYDASEGQVLVGGRDVREYDLQALRDQVAVVLQKNVLFSGTIKENLRWGDENASDEELVRVCRLAQADEFIQQFPDKYDTYIEQGGTNVSGGQKQRLSLARALLKKPKILILDDSTSAVDTKTEALIRRALHSEIPDTTKIIIAQRVSSVEDADRVIIMDGGRIAECGSPAELLAGDTIFKEIYDAQTSGKEAC